MIHFSAPYCWKHLTLLFIFAFPIGSLAQINCVHTGACDENLVCGGDFEDVPSCNFDAAPLSDYGRFASTINTGQLDNSAHLLPSSCNIPGGCPPPFGQCPDDPTWHCQLGPGSVTMPDPTVIAPSNVQYGAIASVLHNTETFVFDLKRPLQAGCHQLNYWVATGCPAEVEFIFSQEPPCPHQMMYPNLGIGQSCSPGGTWTPDHVVTDFIGGSFSSNSPQWQPRTININSANTLGAEYLLVYVKPDVTGAEHITFFDEISLRDCDQLPVEITATTVSGNACVGGMFEVEVDVFNPNNASIIGPFTLQADVSGAGGDLTIVSSPQFGSNGISQPITNFAAGSTVTRTLLLELSNTASLGNSFCVDVTASPEVCINNAPIQACVTAVQAMNVTPSVTHPTCFGFCDGVVDVSIMGGTAPFSYTDLSGAPIALPLSSLCGNTSYPVRVTDSEGCIVQSNGTLIEPPYLDFTINSTTDETCPGKCDAIIDITATGGVLPYTFTANGNPHPSGMFTNLCPIVQAIEVTDAYGCTYAATIPILSTSGVSDWPKEPESVGADRARAEGLAQNESDEEFYLTGWFRGSINFGNNYTTNYTLHATGGANDEDVFVAKFNNCGVIWAYGFGSAGDDRGWVIRFDPEENVLYAGGEVHGSWNGYTAPGSSTSLLPGFATNLSGSLPLSSNLGQKGYVMQIDAITGNPKWIWIAGDVANRSSSVRELSMLRTDLAAGIDFEVSLDIGANSYASIGGTDIAIVHLQINGFAQMADYFGSVGNDGCRGLDNYFYTLGQNDLPSVVASGFLGAGQGVFNQNPTTFFSGTQNHAFVSKHEAPVIFNNPSQILVFNSTDDASAEDITCNEFEQLNPSLPGYTGIFVTGNFEDQLLASSTQFSNSGSQDMFVAGLNWDLTHAWEISDGGPSNLDHGTTIHYTANQEVLAGGYMSGTAFSSVLAPLAPTGGPTDEEVYVLDLNPTTGLPNNTWPGANLGTGPHNRIYDLEGAPNYLYTCGSFGGDQLASYAFGNAVAENHSAEWEAYYARMDYSGVYQPRLEITSSTINVETNGIEVFPNPSSGEVSVRWADDNVTQIQVLDLQGRLIRDLDQLEGINATTINLADQAQGVYLIRVTTGSNVETIKLVKE